MTPNAKAAVQRSGHRPDIEGLRAWAVMPVILFHFGVPGLGGGFVGVDVFFVISGYLITRLILAERAAGSFSFARFYARRAWRLLPAFLATVMVTILLTEIWLSALDRGDARTAVAFALASLSNVYFWLTAGYFDGAALSKPLLHTWSLSVEGQFYLLWPALLMLFARRALWVVLGALAASSLAVSVAVAPRAPEAAFYLTPFRVFEFAIGAAVLLADRAKPGNAVREAALLAGIAMIVAAVLLFDAATPFPGFAALLPCAGTALCIWGGQARFSGFALTNPAAVWIGRVSYSAYLIHWPMIVFFDAIAFRAPEPTEQALLVAATLALAGASYVLIETPFRRPFARPLTWGGLRAVLLAVPLAFLGIVASCNPAKAEDGLIEVLSRREYVADRDRLFPLSRCGEYQLLCGSIDPARYNILVIGDSFAFHATTAIAAGWPEANMLLSRYTNCFVRPHRDPPNPKCLDVYEQRADALRGIWGRIDLIVLSFRPPLRDNNSIQIADYMRELVGHGVPIVIFGEGLRYERPFAELYERFADADNPRPDLSRFRKERLPGSQEVLRAAANNIGAVFVERFDYLCPDGACLQYTDDGNLLIFDEGHLTYAGSQQEGRYLRQHYPNLLSPR